jgi:hypothetical protein
MPPASAGAAGAVQLASAVETGEGSSAAKAVTPAGLAAAEMTWTAPHVFRSVDAGAAEAVAIDLDRASPTPAANDLLMALRWKMRDAGGGTDVAAKLVAKLLDATAGSEDAELQFATLAAGAVAARLILGQGLYTPGAAGGDKGADTINAQAIYQNGVPHAMSDVIVTGTSASPALADHGKLYIPTDAGFALTLPALSGLFNGYKLGLHNQCSSGACLATRSSTDVIASQGATALTSITLPSVGDQVWFIADVTNSRWIIRGKRSFEGVEIATTTGTATSQAHSLGVLPKSVQLFLRNKIAEKNYAVGDEVQVGWSADQGSTQRGAMVVADQTNLTCLTVSTAAIGVLDKSSPATYSAITGANWRYVVRAVVYN